MNARILAGALAAGLAATAGAQAAETLKFHHDLPEASAQHMGALKFKELVEAATDRFVVEIYPNNALGDDVEVAQQMQFGAVHAAPIPTAKLSSFSPALQLIDLPFLFPSVEVTHAVLDDPAVGGALLATLSDAGFHGVAFWESGFKQLTCNHPVTSPADYEARRVRVMESPLLVAQFEVMGATAIPIAFSETYTALQQGVVECQENPLVSIRNMRFYEVQDYMMISNHGYLGTAFIFSKVWFDGLEPELQEILTSAALEAGAHQRDLSGAMADGFLQEIRDAGGTEIIELSLDQLAAFAAAMEPVHAQFADRIGADLVEAAKDAVAALTAQN